MPRTQTFIHHLAGYVPAPASIEYNRDTGKVGYSGGNLERTVIIHEQNSPPPISAADELDRWSINLDDSISNQADMEMKLKNLVNGLKNAHNQYTGLATNSERQTYILNTFDDLLKAVSLLTQFVGKDFSNNGL